MLCSSAIRAGSVQDKREVRTVGPGVRHVHETRSSGPFNINVVEVELKNPVSMLESEPAQEKLFAGEQVAGIARRETEAGNMVIGAINGDFWTSTPRPYIPIGLLVSDGMIYNNPYRRTVLALSENDKPFIGIVSLKTTIQMDGHVISIPRLNDSRTTSSLVLFTPPFGNELTPVTGTTYVELELTGEGSFLPNRPVTANVTQILQDQPVPLREKHLVLAIPAAAHFPSVEKGRLLTVHATIPEIKGSVTYCIGGGPRIVRSGRVSVEWLEEEMSSSFAADRHPRTAVGISKNRDKAFLVTVDGRQPEISIGMNLTELGEYMQGLGCAEAVNLDGGGSTTMIVRGQVVNRPSDLRGPRTVANALLVTTRATPGTLKHIELQPTLQASPMPAGAALHLSAYGFDRNYNPVDFSSDLLWTAERSIGTIEATGTQAVLRTPSKATNGRIHVKSGGGSGGMSVRTSSADTITVQPSPLVLFSNEEVDILVTAKHKGKALFLTPDMIALNIDGDGLSANGLRVQGVKAGEGRLAINIGSESVTVPYYVDRFRSEIIESFDSGAFVPAGVYFDAAATTVSPEPGNHKEGSACTAVTYKMTRGGRSRIQLPVGSAIATQPSKLGMWIYGDGQEAWVRAAIEDSKGNEFTADFTEGGKGVHWKNEWRLVASDVIDWAPSSKNPGKNVVFPVKVRNVSVAQDQEALKRSGNLLLDGLQAIYAPE